MLVAIPLSRTGARSVRSDQDGMAVVAMLLVVAVVAVLAAALMARQSTVIQNAQLEQTRAQAHWLLRGELSRVQTNLQGQAQRLAYTRLDGSWNRRQLGIIIGTLEGRPARLYGEVVDEQSKFNLRNLVEGGVLQAEQANSFLRLCGFLGIAPAQGRDIIRRVALSLVEPNRPGSAPRPSTDQQAQTQRQKVLSQLGLPTRLPARAQAPRLRTLDELQALKGIDPATIERLRPFVTLLPVTTSINANTARAEVLAAAVPGLTLERARALLGPRDSGQWFLHRSDIQARLQTPGAEWPAHINLGTTSHWFLSRNALKGQGSLFIAQSLLHDDKQGLPRVIWTRFGP